MNVRSLVTILILGSLAHAVSLNKFEARASAADDALKDLALPVSRARTASLMHPPGVSVFEFPLEKRAGNCTSTTSCYFTDTCCYPLHSKCCPTASYYCVVGGCCALGKICSGPVERCPSNPAKIYCVGGGCCDPSQSCGVDSNGKHICLGKADPPEDPDPTEDPDDDPAPTTTTTTKTTKTSTSTTISSSSSFGLITIPSSGPSSTVPTSAGGDNTGTSEPPSNTVGGGDSTLPTPGGSAFPLQISSTMLILSLAGSLMIVIV
ncbi:hypothetical protein BKA62DRAFT_761653 [Auriculariales sp. MPI-PUGE-AT-0066]|nr:hypothetical protein BKA62DRAFT_761653 [Auriculariales sp. MPI-PUGE-AT-0066]